MSQLEVCPEDERTWSARRDSAGEYHDSVGDHHLRSHSVMWNNFTIVLIKNEIRLIRLSR